ncbi:unnamed protein product [Caenorhabditis sp. 36 PRJEB53466]|nr:unnamed protein product [Caenorhabditis sp. 36 PRJEB53466]
MPAHPYTPAEDRTIIAYVTKRVDGIYKETPQRGPLPARFVWKYYNEWTRSERTSGGVQLRYQHYLAPKLHEMDELDVATKVRMLFFYGTPVDREFLEKLKTSAEVIVDEYGRILKYSEHASGGMQLSDRSGLAVNQWNERKSEKMRKERENLEIEQQRWHFSVLPAKKPRFVYEQDADRPECDCAKSTTNKKVFLKSLSAIVTQVGAPELVELHERIGNAIRMISDEEKMPVEIIISSLETVLNKMERSPRFTRRVSQRAHASRRQFELLTVVPCVLPSKLDVSRPFFRIFSQNPRMSSRKRGITPSREGAGGTRRKKSFEETDSIEVVCRLCPYNGSTPSLVAIDDNAVQTVLPPANFRRENAPQVEKIFKFGRVFSENDGQATVFERTSVDLVLNLLKGQNSLLFTYGVTGSGKTYTMTGKPTETGTGLLPRTIDVIFNSIANRVDKCVFYPAALNTFEIRSALDSHLKRNQLANEQLSTSRELTDRYREPIKVSGYNEDMVCSVFVNYVEIYNNLCYDLLEDARNGFRSLTKRELRQDRQQQIYVDGAKDVEVSSAEEALEIFCLGEERRRVSSTLLNKDSSRSHSVFTIKLVMAPRAYDAKNVYPVADSSKIVVSQLCLVDLAGSERAKRTQNVGERLAEANNINKSLMVLRQCIDVLRRNQKSSGAAYPEQVPYREQKLTHLFKNYLEGNGQIRMVICVNPKPEDYDENMSALAFAEESQAIEVKKQVERMPSSDRIPHAFFTQWNAELDASVRYEDEDGRSETPCPPTFCLRDYNDNATVETLRTYVRQLQEQYGSDDGSSSAAANGPSLLAAVRSYMMEADYQRIEIGRLRETLEAKNAEIQKLRGFCSRYKRENQSLKERIHSCEQEEEENVQAMNRLMEQKEEDRKIIQSQKKAMKHVRGIMENAPSPSVASLRSRFDQENARPTAPMQTPPPPYQTPGRGPVFRKRLEATTSTTGVAVIGGGQGYVNPKYQRRSKSAGRLLDHQSRYPVPTGTVLQSRTPGNAIRTTKPEVHQLNKSGEYRLTHQEVDKEGNISTNIVKGDVIPTASGGTAVFFNDIEKLTHESPTTRK